VRRKCPDGDGGALRLLVFMTIAVVTGAGHCGKYQVQTSPLPGIDNRPLYLVTCTIPYDCESEMLRVCPDGIYGEFRCEDDLAARFALCGLPSDGLPPASAGWPHHHFFCHDRNGGMIDKEVARARIEAGLRSGGGPSSPGPSPARPDSGS
jgi:hypothetical protein